MTGVKFTANRLDDGVVVWLTARLVWSEAAREAGTFAEDDEDRAAATARSAVAAACHRNEIVAAYEVAVDGRADISMREHIRSRRGPTITPPTDAGPTDAGPTDAGPGDAEPGDAGPTRIRRLNNVSL